MANTFYREPLDGGDLDNWGRKDQEQPRRSIGEITCKLFDDSGTLKLKVGRIGFDNGSSKGTAYIDTETIISLAGVSNSNWALVELSVSGTTPTIAATDLSGATDESQVYTTFTSFYDPEKGGFYVTATKRVIGLVYKDSGGSLSSILNCGNGEEFLLEWAAGSELYYKNGKVRIYNAEMMLEDQKASTTDGGTFTTGAWRTRDLNTEVKNTIQGASLGSNQITLPAGTYRIRAKLPFRGTERTKARLYNVSDVSTEIWGTNGYGASAGGSVGWDFVEGIFTIAAEKTLEVQHNAQQTSATGGFGLSVGAYFTIDHETYTQVFIKRIA